jgi:hypothetical protein
LVEVSIPFDNNYANAFIEINNSLTLHGERLQSATARIDRSGFHLSGTATIGDNKVALKGDVTSPETNFTGSATVSIPMNWVDDSVQWVTDKALCGFDVVEDAALCGTTTAANGLKCGETLFSSGCMKSVTSGVLCGYGCNKYYTWRKLVCKDSYPKTCNVTTSCYKPNTCTWTNTCDRIKTCERKHNVKKTGQLSGTVNFTLNSSGITGAMSNAVLVGVGAVKKSAVKVKEREICVDVPIIVGTKRVCAPW